MSGADVRNVVVCRDLEELQVAKLIVDVPSDFTLAFYVMPFGSPMSSVIVPCKVTGPWKLKRLGMIEMLARPDSQIIGLVLVLPFGARACFAHATRSLKSHTKQSFMINQMDTGKDLMGGGPMVSGGRINCEQVLL